MTRAQFEALQRIVHARVGKLCEERGWSVDDLVQDVVERALTRSSTAAFDPDRAGWSTYVVQLCNNVVSRRLRRAATEREALHREAREVRTELGSDVVDQPDDDDLALIQAIARDARPVLSPVGWVTVRTWLEDGREVEHIARRARLDAETVWRYLALQLVRLRDGTTMTEWRAVWERQRCFVTRKLRKLRGQASARGGVR